MKENGILAKPTHEHTIRFTPPLIINEEQMMEAVSLIQKSMREFE
jgi:ornithine--oxo-acid transaminase